MMPFFKALPALLLLFFLLLAISKFYQLNLQKKWFQHEIRSSIVVGILITICWALLGAVILSFFRLLNFPLVFLWWLAVVCFFLLKGGLHAFFQFLKVIFLETKKSLSLTSWINILIYLYVAIVLLLAFVMAVFSPPNNNDSMIYHLPRQLLWMSNSSVFISEAPNIFMLKWPPLSEYIGVNLWILADSDRLHNLVQWGGLVGCLVVLSMVLDHIGAQKVIAPALALVVSVPAIFYQASNTKNDILVGFFLVVLVWLTEEAVKKREVTRVIAIFTGIGVGCALMIKGTSLIYLSVLFPFLLIVRIILNKVSIKSTSIILAFIISLLLAAPHYARHTKDILEGDTGAKSEHKNASINLSNALSVLSKNVGLQIALPNEKFNIIIQNIIEKIHKKIGVSVNSLETSFHQNPFAVIYWPNSEDNVTSILHIFLILFLPIFGFYEIFWKKSSAGVYCFLPFLLLFAFSALLKWQPWHTRLLIPIEIIAGVPFGILLSKISYKFIQVLLVGFSGWWLFPCLRGWHRPVLGYQPIYFMNDLDQRAMKAPREAFDTIALSKILSQIKPNRINLNAPFYTPLVYTMRDSRKWPEIITTPRESSNADVVMKAILSEEQVPMPSRGMVRIYESNFSYLDIDKNLLNQSESIELPAFTGIKNILGMEEPIGPFPLAKQPIFCHAHYPSVTFDLPVNASLGFLKLEMALPYFNKLDENTCEIYLNEEKVSEIHMVKEKKGRRLFSQIISIPAGNTPCQVKLKFRNFAPDSDSKVAASITGIQFRESNSAD
jgi:hypothetical protein